MGGFVAGSRLLTRSGESITRVSKGQKGVLRLNMGGYKPIGVFGLALNLFKLQK